MGDRLWTSKDGYRRKGTSLIELREIIDKGLTASAICEPLMSCLAYTQAPEAAALLSDRHFDVAGVMEKEFESVIGWVSIEHLKYGLVKDHVQTISASLLASDNTPLPEVMSALKVQPHIFILRGKVVAGILTRADLNKPPVRLYLFSLVSLLEMHLGFWVGEAYPNDSWQKALSPDRLEKAKDVQLTRRELNQDPLLIDCLQFCDKGDLVIADEELRSRIGLDARKGAKRLFERANKLRDSLAHSQHDLVDGTSWEAVIDLVEQVERVLHASDVRVGRGDTGK